MTQESFIDYQRKLQLLSRANRELVKDVSLRQTLTNVLKESIETVDGERGSIVALDEKHEPIEAVLIYHGKLINQTTKQLKNTIAHGLAGWALQHETPVLIPDTSVDERWTRRPDDKKERSGAKCAICVPLVSHNEVVGVMTIVHSKPGFFTQEHFELLQTIGDLAGIAIANARLFMRLEKAQQRYQTLFEASSDMLIITDWDGRVVETNRVVENFTGFKSNFSTDARITDFHKPFYTKLGGGFANLHNESPIVYESELKLSDGGELPIEVKVSPVTIGKSSFLQWVLRDITERKRFAAMQEDLMTMVYHDIRSPLSNVVSSLDILSNQLDQDEDESIKTILSVARRSAERLMRLVNSLLDIRMLEQGQSLVQMEKENPRQVLKEAIEASRSIASVKHIKINSHVSSRVPDVDMDRDMIRRVLINLLENAIKFSSSRQEVSVTIKEINGSVEFSVEDAGPGIPEDQLESIFFKYTRLKTSPSGRGFGLGLAFCKLAIDAHHGKIWAENRPDAGSRFVFSLPIKTK